MTLTARATANVALGVRNTADLGSDSGNRSLSLALELANGTGAGQADLAFTDTRTLAASATEDLDLSGALGGLAGSGAQVFARVKLLVVQAAPGNTNNVQMTRPASNGFPLFLAAGDGIALRPGEFLILAADDSDATGHAVTAGTGDLLTFTNSGAGTSVSYSVMIVGCSA
jgi:hypothetical protein